jgi:hypothetical protein
MSISGAGEVVSSKNGAQPLQQPLSAKEISGKISSIKAIQIELIGGEIINSVLNNLGPIGKARVAQEVMQVTGVPKGPKGKMMCLTMMNAKMDVERGKEQFFSDKVATRFMLSALGPVKTKIIESFSTPSFFVESGLNFQISDYEPMGFVREIAEEMGIDLTLNDVPSKYYVRLELDEKLTQEKADLVFAIIQQSDGVIFSQKTFTIGKKIRSRL